MKQNEMATAKLEDAAQRILDYGAGRHRTVHQAVSHPDHRSNHDAGTLEVPRAVIDFQDERILAFIEPDGTITVDQNWSEMGQRAKARIVAPPSDEGRAAYDKIAGQLAGKVPHPPVEWTMQKGPWCVARMNGEVIVEAGAASNMAAKQCLPGV